jgi:lysophospholipid acyltransferase (LPLAT)-like uncharacterized protein
MKENRELFVISSIIRFFLRVLGMTWRVRFDLNHNEPEGGYIYAFWHRYIFRLRIFIEIKVLGL